MIDEAFMPFQQIIRNMLSFGGEVLDEEAGIHSYIYECEIESPVELDISRNPDGQLQIGSTPPIYYVNTSLRPAFHKLRFRAELSQVSDGD